MIQGKAERKMMDKESRNVLLAMNAVQIHQPYRACQGISLLLWLAFTLKLEMLSKVDISKIFKHCKQGSPSCSGGGIPQCKCL